MKKLSTLGHPSKCTEFTYRGSVRDGVTLDQTGDPRIDAGFFTAALMRFAGREIMGGFSMTDPPAGGFGEWVQENSPVLNSRALSPRHGSFMAAILCHEVGVRSQRVGLSVWLTFPPIAASKDGQTEKRR